MTFHDECQQEIMREMWDTIAASERNSGLLAVTGDTYPHRRAISALGGVWDRAKQAWLVPASRKSEVLKLRGVVVA